MTLDWRENDYLAAGDAWREVIQNPFLASLHENRRWQRWTRELDSVLTNRRTAEAQWVTR